MSRTSNARSADHPVFRDAGNAASRVPGAPLPGTFNRGGRDVAGLPPRPLWGWLILALVLMVAGPVACHHEADGSPFCAEKSCEVTP